jgi:GcrA cell cycle regulator
VCESLKKMWLEGMSASQIAAEFGDVTRNAVIGKVHRLGLSGRGKPTTTINSKNAKPKTSRSKRPSVASTAGRTQGALALKPEMEKAPDANPETHEAGSF